MIGHTADMKKRRRRRRRRRHQRLCCSSEPTQQPVAERSCASRRRLLFSAATSSSSSVLLSCSAPAPPPPRLALHHPLGVAAALALALLLLFSSNAVPVSASRRWSSSEGEEELVWSPKMARIQRHLGGINKPAVRSIESLDGDIIDCVARHKQLALDHPLLKKHKIQRVPPQIPTSSSPRTAGNESSSRTAWQTWHHVGHCPKGTVPVRRTSAEDVMRARSLFRFGRKKKKHQLLAPPAAAAANAPDIITGNGHEHAIAYTSAAASGSSSVYGAKATINVWDPAIQESNGFSLSQLWILSGSFNGSDLNSIEAGWQSDAYEATGCYNALCPGFVQTSSRIAIGASISPVSSQGGSQYDMTLLIWKDPKLGNWWLSYGDGGKEQLVGYWPAELFTHLSDHATMVEWGGEVVNTRPDGLHTATQMGSGRFAGEGFGRASYFRNLETVDADNSLAAVPLDAIQTLAEDAGCYDIQKAYDDDGGKHSGGGWGTHFYYGGPGHNPACP